MKNSRKGCFEVLLFSAPCNNINVMIISQVAAPDGWPGCILLGRGSLPLLPSRFITVFVLQSFRVGYTAEENVFHSNPVNFFYLKIP